MKKLVITIRYDGTNYHGWQVQDNVITVQQTFQDAVEKVFQSRLDVVGCSRTDAGVHANMYVLSLDTDMDIDCKGVIAALNTKLPKDIAVIDCKVGENDFHPRYSCVSKEYIYKLYNGKIRDPFLANYSYFYKYPIDADYLNEQAQAFVGTYDYSGFCSVKSKVMNTVRTVKSFSVARDGDMVIFKVEADGFLYNMVRIMVETLLFVSEGKIKKDTLKDIILSKDRKKAGKTAPPQGLYLNKVNYQS
ncbi:MAG: tRNA pseudouridine(38-40) synthase TruA [Clostridiales bacterium]|nr:tRNA pseudouridine(38-40) synthase TruA [Clostridiales bacterium]